MKAMGHRNISSAMVYIDASDEMVSSAALPSLLIILTALVPAIFLNKLLLKNASDT